MTAWPTLLLPAKDVAWTPRQMVRTVPVATDGFYQPRRSTDMGGKWELTMSGVWLRRGHMIKLARALRVIANGGLTPFVVRTCETKFAPWLDGAGYHLVPHSDDTPFSDSSLYLGEGISVESYGVTASGATSLVVTLSESAPFTGGEAFSVVHETMGERRYEVGSASAVASNRQTLTFWPPLREALADDTALNLAFPGCLMVMTNPEDFIDPINMGRRSYASPSFMEYGDVAP